MPSDLNKQIIALWNKGVSSGQIAKETGLSRSAVMGRVCRLRASGLKLAERPVTPKGSWRPWTKDRWSAASALIREGMSAARAADALGTSKHSLESVLARRGGIVSLRPSMRAPA